MKELAMKTKLIVRPIVGCLTHSHFWEGSCRAGHKEDMTQEAEAKAADAAFEAAKEILVMGAGLVGLEIGRAHV